MVGHAGVSVDCNSLGNRSRRVDLRIRFSEGSDEGNHNARERGRDDDRGV
jgi:hypothetical protein